MVLLFLKQYHDILVYVDDVDLYVELFEFIFLPCFFMLINI
jgi:hypothetical protein